jgi:hypothetical protein
MHTHINESLSQNGKIAFNDNQVSFKTNTQKSILQHLAWQYNDKYLGVVKTVSNWSGKSATASIIKNYSNNGTPFVFDKANIVHDVTLILQNKEYAILRLTYLHAEKEVVKYVDDEYLDFFVMLYNGTWHMISNNKVNAELFDMFEDIDDNMSYVNTDLPTAKLPKIISPVSSINAAKSLLQTFATNYKLEQYSVGSFKITQPVKLLCKKSQSKFSSFVPDINEFLNFNTELYLEANTDIAYLSNADNDTMIFYANNLWYLLDNAEVKRIITSQAVDIFVDTVKQSMIAAKLNKGVKTDDIYQAIAKLRAIGLLNGITKSFTHAGYFYVQNMPSFIPHFAYSKAAINAEGFMTKIYHGNDNLVLYKDSILIFVCDTSTDIVIIQHPTKQDLCYVTNINSIQELVNEFTKGPLLDSVVSIADIYFKDTSKKKK